MAADLFKSKSFLQLVDSMILTARGHTERITDYNVGSVARTLLEAPAIEIDALYQAMVLNLMDAIPIALYQGFDFTPLPAVAAAGTAVLSLSEAQNTVITIPAGTRIRSSSAVDYETQQAVEIPIGTLSVSVPIACTQTGSIGNTLSNTLVFIDASLVTVSNPTAISGGRGEETHEEQKARFIRYVKSLARGTVASLDYAARTAQVLSLTGLVMEQAARVSIEETPGHVNVWIYNGHGNTSDTLLENARRIIDGYYEDATAVPGYRPAGMRVDVLAMEEQSVAVNIELQVDAAYRTTETRSAVIAALSSAINTELVLKPSSLINSVLMVPYVNGAQLLAPTQSIVIPANKALVPGEMAISYI